MLKKLFPVLFIVFSTALQAQQLDVRVRAMLQGSYAGNQMMKTLLSGTGRMSQSQPYTGYPWFYHGTERLDSIPADMVDWVLIELRDQQNTSSGLRAGILLKDGSVVDTNLQPFLRFPGLTNGSYYIGIDHRNHLPVLSAYPVFLPNATPWDFSDTLACPPFGGGSKALWKLEGNVHGLIVGDINKDGVIKFSGPQNDRSLIQQRIISGTNSTNPLGTLNGYYPEDISMDGVVKYSGPGNDPSYIIQSIVGITNTTVITSSHPTPTPCIPPDTAYAGEDTLGLTDTVFMLVADTPTIGAGKWQIIQGAGGKIDTTNSPSAQFTGRWEETYTLTWTVYNNCGSNTDTVRIGFAARGFECGDSLVDSRDGKSYPTTQIGQQCWMAENLNVGRYIESTITQSPHTDASDNGIIEKFCYDNDTVNCDIYGGMYSWDEAMDYDSSQGSRGICPEGWHLPTDAEWMQLEGTLDARHGVGDPFWNSEGWRGSSLGPALKETGLDTWLYPNVGAGNGAGFNGQGGGRGTDTGWFYAQGWYGYYWTSNYRGFQHSWIRIISSFHLELLRGSMNIYRGGSVRCVMDSLVGTCPEPKPSAYAGRDSVITGMDTIRLYAEVPATGTGSWTEITDGVIYRLEERARIFDINDPESYMVGEADSTYTLLWTVCNNCGCSSDTVTIRFSKRPFECRDDLVDPRDGRVYKTVAIGEQCWMAEDLKIGTMVTYAAGGPSDNGVTEKYCYNNDTNHCETYGGLYSWDEAMDYSTAEGSRGICPEGWHIPTDAEFKVLEGSVDSAFGIGDPVWDNMGYRGSNAGGELKETGFDYWNNPNSGATNGSGFSARGGGYHLSVGPGYFYQNKQSAAYWTSSASSAFYSYYRMISYSLSRISRFDNSKATGYAIRCVWDSVVPPCAPLPDTAIAGKDSLNVSGLSITLNANAPVVGSGQWSILSGQGGSFADSTSATSVFNGQGDETYELVWTVSTLCGSTSDTVVISFAPYIPPFVCGDSLIDPRDYRRYATVQLGERCWMAENLNHGIQISGSDQSNNGSIEKYCYDDDSLKCEPYGGLYQWNELMAYSTAGGQGICPDGWILPADTDWMALINGQGGPGMAGNHLKEQGALHWTSPNSGATNVSGFTALAGGSRMNGTYASLLDHAHFWSSSTASGGKAWSYALSHDTSFVSRNESLNGHAFSLRCVQDTLYPCTEAPDQADAGQDTIVTPATSITLPGVAPSVGSGFWRVQSGSGAQLAQPSNAASAFTGSADTVYTLIWTVYNTCGYSEDTLVVRLGITLSIFSCDSLIDARDGRVYATVKIGDQCWMAENLDHGTQVPSDSLQQHNSIVEKYCYNDQSSYCDIAGGMYQWNELMNHSGNSYGQGICPDGWRLPGDQDWKELEQFLEPGILIDSTGWRGSLAGTALLSGGNSGFEALPGGILGTTASFSGYANEAAYWTSSPAGAGKAYMRRLSTSLGGVFRGEEDQHSAAYLRCVRGQAIQVSQNFTIINPDELQLISDSSMLAQGVYRFQDLTNGSVSLNVGDLLVDTTGYGYLRKATGVSVNGNIITVNTDEGTLEDLILNGDFSGSTTLPGYGTKSSAVDDELLYLIPGAKASKTNGVYGFRFDNVVLFNNSALRIEFRKGSFSIDPNIVREMTFANGTLQQASFYLDKAPMDASMELKVELKNTTNLVNADMLLASFARPFLVWFGPVPVVMAIRVNVEAKWNLNSFVKGSITVIDSTHLKLSTGMNYQRNSDNASFFFDYTAEPRAGNIDLNLAGGLEQVFRIVPKLELLVFNKAVPYFSVEGGEKLTAEIGLLNGAPTGTLAKYELGYEVKSGLDISKLIPKTKVLEKKWDSGKFLLWRTPQKLSVESGNNQFGHPDQLLKRPIKVKVVDSRGRPALRVPVDFNIVKGNGSLSASRVLIDSMGFAEVEWTFGNDEEEQKVEASVIGWDNKPVEGSPVTFRAVLAKCPDTLVDPRDGQVYPVIQIELDAQWSNGTPITGHQCWMGKNLNIGTMVPSVQDTGVWNSEVLDNGIIEKYCYENDPSYCSIYGGIYDWDEAMNYQDTIGDICPPGWHIPSSSEWARMLATLDSVQKTISHYTSGSNFPNYKGTNVGEALKEAGTQHWADPNFANNTHGFAALPNAYRYVWGGWSVFNPSVGGTVPLFDRRQARFWTSQPVNSTRAMHYLLENLRRSIGYHWGNKVSGAAVRCIMD